MGMLTGHSLSGTSLSIKASGILKEKVEKGAYVILQVKYGVITLIKQTVDLCDQVSEVDLDCPLEEGPLTLVKEVELPKQIPPVRISLNICGISSLELSNEYFLLTYDL
jgi:hypothetical protein